MNRSLTLGVLALAVGVSYGLYELSYEVQRLAGDLTRLNRQLLATEESNRVLRAEWSYLNRPAALQQLAAKHLDLTPIAPHQVVARVADLPLKGEPALGAASVPLPRRRPVGTIATPTSFVSAASTTPTTAAAIRAARSVLYRNRGQ